MGNCTEPWSSTFLSATAHKKRKNAFRIFTLKEASQYEKIFVKVLKYVLTANPVDQSYILDVPELLTSTKNQWTAILTNKKNLLLWKIAELWCSRKHIAFKRRY